MSALARPLQRPETQPTPRHIEVVPTREQRTSRPRVVYAIAIVSGLFAILIAQLLLSIAVSDGAYEIRGLQQQQRELQRDEELLMEQLQVLESPQHLAANAVSLGMVGNTTTTYLRLSDGAVLGSAVPAKSSDRIAMGPEGMTLISNSLLAPVAPAAADNPDALVSTDDSASLPADVLPAPKTR